MRIYGMKSGRNNMSKLIARSYMYNSKKKNNTKAKQNNVSNTNEYGCGTILFIIIVFILLIISFM